MLNSQLASSFRVAANAKFLDTKGGVKADPETFQYVLNVRVAQLKQLPFQ